MKNNRNALDLFFTFGKIIKGCRPGLKPAVVSLIGTAVIPIGHTVFFLKESTSLYFQILHFMP